MPTITPQVADQAGRIQADLNNRVNSIRTNGDLTIEARNKYLAQAYIEAVNAMMVLQSTFTSTQTAVADTSERDIFGAVSSLGADAISARDADDRAARVETPAEAQELLDRAEQNGDTVLARAIALRAYRASRSEPLGQAVWGEVVEGYAEGHPDAAAAMAKIDQARRDDVAANVQSMFIFAVPKPGDLARYTDYQLRAMAAS